MGANYSARLCEWIEENGVEGPRGGSLWQVGPRTLLPWLNEIESRFDELIVEQCGPGWLDWDSLRAELRLPRPTGGAAELAEEIQLMLVVRDLPEPPRQRAARLWQDFVLLQEEEVRPHQLPAGWGAALEYLLQGLYFAGGATQEEIGQSYGVSTSTVGLRFRTLVEMLGIVLFDSRARKRLLALRTVTVERGLLSEAEFNHRLMHGEPLLH